MQTPSDENQITIPYNYKPRWYQVPFWVAMEAGCKRAVLVQNRRAGKDITAWNWTIRQAVEIPGIYYYIFPSFAQGRKVLWDGKTIDGNKFLNFIPKSLVHKVNNTEMKITLTNESLIQIVGSDNYDALRGTNPIGCVFSEYADQDPMAWQSIRPILDINKGWAVFCFTPKGNNHGKFLFDMAKENKNWYASLLTVEDTKLLTEDEIQKIREEGMSEEMIRQEYYCDFAAGIQGAYYARYVTKAYKDQRICKSPIDSHLKVHTAWDLGVADSTCIIFFQIYGKEIRIVDYYENSGEGLPHYAKILQDKDYLYGSHYAPHDIEARDFSHGLSRKVVARGLGIHFKTLPTLKLGKHEAIENVRGMFNRFWIDEVKCKHLIECLENYKKKWNDKLQMFSETPQHDWSSHGADATSYMCLAIKQLEELSTYGVSDKEAERLHDKYNPVFR